MKKQLLKSLTLCSTLLLGTISYSQNWAYVGSANSGVNTGGGNGVSGRDLCVVSDQEIYTAMHASSSDQIEVYKYDGTSWTTLPNASTSGQIIGNTVLLKKAKTSNDLYLAYSYFSSSSYIVAVKKYDGTAWSQVSTTLPLAGGSSVFGFQLDNDDKAIVLGSKSFSFDLNRISRLESGSWVHYTIPNSTGSIFEDNMSYVDNANNLVFAWQKTVSLSSTPASIDTLSGSTIKSTPENINMAFSGIMRFLSDGSGNQTIYNYNSAGANKFALRSIKQTGGSWNVASVDTVGWTGPSCIEMASNGKTLIGAVVPNTTNISKMFLANNYTTPVFEPSVGSTIYKIRFSSGYAYALLNNGVVKEDLSMISGLNERMLNNTLSVYPNPANNTINIQGINEPVNIKVISVDGKIVLNQAIQASTIDISNLTSGMYFIELTDRKGNIGLTKFIKE